MSDRVRCVSADREPSRPFFHRVESLRGIGAAIVAGWHLSGWMMQGRQLLPHEPWVGVGPLQNAIGVLELKLLLPAHAALMMFFVISGFVLRVSLQYGPQDSMRAAVRFHLARIFRIYPITVCAAVATACALGWREPSLEGGAMAMPLSATTFVANLLLLDVSLNSVLWAIQLEVVMAPIILLLYFLERRWGERVLILVAVVASALSFHGGWAFWKPLSHNLFAFVLGMLIPTLGRRLVCGLGRGAVDRLLFGATICLFLTYPLVGLYSRFSALFEGYAATLLISVMAYRPELGSVRFLDARLLRAMGLSSGSYYVLHMLLLSGIAPWVERCLPAALVLRAPALAGPVAIVLCLAAMVPIAMLGHRLVEAPGIALGRRLIDRIGC